MAATEADGLEFEGACASGGLWGGASLETERLILRPVKPGDAPAIAAMVSDWEVARFTANIPHPYPPGAAEAFIAEATRARALGTGLIFAVVRREDERLVGTVALMIFGHEAEIGYWLGREHWGQGLAGEAVRALVRVGFRWLRLERIRAAVHPQNPASRRVLDKAGFRYAMSLPSFLPERKTTADVHYLVLDSESFIQQQRQRPVVLVAAVALVDSDGRVLLTQRPPGKSMAGLWEFPGGKIEPGETPEDALKREMDEELGIDISESCLAPFAFASHAYDGFHLLMPLYLCRNWRGRPQAREGQVLKWVRASRMDALPMPPADVPLVAMLRDLL